MSDDPPPNPPPNVPPDGWERACEGILRTEFGRRPSDALARAMAELRAEAAPAAARRETVPLGTRVQDAWARLRHFFTATTAVQRQWAGAGVVALLLLTAGLAGARLWMNRGALEVVSVRGPASLVRPGGAEGLRAGLRARPGATVSLESNAVVTLRYPGEATTLELRGPAALAPQRPDAGKRLRLDRGEAVIVAARQPAGEPLRIRTPQGEAEVVGTAFTLAARRASTWLEVGRGTVNLHRFASATARTPEASATVSAGAFAVAAPGVPLVARPQEHDPANRPRLPLTLDFARGSASGDGDWARTAAGLRQRRVAMTPWGSTPDSKPGGRRFPASDFTVPLATGGSLQIEATITVERLPADVRAGADLRSRVGLKLYDGRSLLDFLLTAATPAPSLVFAHTELDEARDFPSRIVAGGPGPALARDTFRLKAQLMRLDSGGVRVAGKVWQGGPEPAGWAIQGEAPGFGAVQTLGLDTMHAAAAFTDVRAWLLD
jgi:hypothetical protein